MKSTRLLSSALIIFLSFSSFCYSQVQTPKYSAINGNCGGYYEYLPQGYGTSTWQSYPLIVALHGIGELGNGTNDLANLLNCWTSLPRLIANGGFPSSFNVGGQSFSFIVISPQFKGWPSAADVNDVVNYAIQNYRIDQSRIYITGLSMGGGATWDFAAAYPTKAAAIVPVCGAAYPEGSKAQAIANAKLPVWATHNQDDPTVTSSYTTSWVSQIIQYGGDAQSTIFPVSGHDAWTKTYDPNFTQNGVNIYQWMLMRQKGNIPNQLPTVNAGSNQTITLPQNSVTLSGSASDPDGTVASYEWTKTSGPSQATIVSPFSLSTVVNDLTQGSYVFSLKATDDKGASTTSNVTITVNPAPNQVPTVNAGTDQTITLPLNSVTLNGSGSDADGTISSFQWSQSSGPLQANIVSTSSPNTVVDHLVQGTYVFTLKATDNQGASAVGTITITVNPVPNKTPNADAGSNQIITLPTNIAILRGAGSDSDGTVSSYQWSQISGPSQANIRSALATATIVDSLKQGVYTFRFTVTDDKGAVAWDDVSITVNKAPNHSPVTDAGSDQTITLPDNSVSLAGVVSDPDGSIVAFEWTQISGPTKSNFSSASPLALTVNNLAQGIYTFRLTATDNDGAVSWDDVKVTVMPDPRTESTAAVYPNPATDIINVKIDALTLQNNGMIKITNAGGNIVYTESFVRIGFRFLKPINISKLTTGIYYLSVTTDIHTTKTLTFIKQ